MIWRVVICEHPFHFVTAGIRRLHIIHISYISICRHISMHSFLFISSHMLTCCIPLNLLINSSSSDIACLACEAKHHMSEIHNRFFSIFNKHTLLTFFKTILVSQKYTIDFSLSSTNTHFLPFSKQS